MAKVASDIGTGVGALDTVGSQHTWSSTGSQYPVCKGAGLLVLGNQDPAQASTEPTESYGRDHTSFNSFLSQP